MLDHLVDGGIGVAENVNVGGNLTVTGNYTVNGTTTFISSSTLEIGDNIIQVNSVSPVRYGGIQVKDLNATETGSMVWDSSNDYWLAGQSGSEYRVPIHNTVSNLTDYKVVVSFADGENGHTGVIYKATNFEYCGKTAPGRTLIVDGEEYHARSLNQPIKPYSREIRKRYDAKDPNIYWKHTKQKYIYVYFLNRKAKKSFDFESIKQ